MFFRLDVEVHSCDPEDEVETESTKLSVGARPRGRSYHVQLQGVVDVGDR
jgi:hypothetical protein